MSDGDADRNRDDAAPDGDDHDDFQYVDRVDCQKRTRKKKAFYCTIPYCDEHITAERQSAVIDHWSGGPKTQRTDKDKGKGRKRICSTG